MDRLHLDLSIVKKEQNLDDYGRSSGNILDNMISDDDFHQQFGGSHSSSTVPNTDEMDVSVDWLSSFFDEPSAAGCGLSPSLSVVASPTVTCTVKAGGLLDDPDVGAGLESCSDDLSQELSYRTVDSLKPNSFASRNPFLSQLECSSALADAGLMDCGIKQLGNIKGIGRTQFIIKKNVHTKQDFLDASFKAAASLKCNSSGGVESLDTEMLTTDIFAIPVKSEAETTDSDSGCRPKLFSINLQREQLIRTRANSYDSNSRSPECVSPVSEGHPDMGLCGDFSPEEKDSYHEDHQQPHERSPFYLTEEERRTLITEGLPVPKGLPLSKVEERALKKVRRKIKNKISAQESRRKKKEYMESLEKKIDGCNSENIELKKNTEKLENTNRSLLLQLQKLQQYVATKVSRSLATVETQTMEYCAV